MNWYPDLLGGIASGNSFSGNNPDRILLKEMVIAQNATIPNHGFAYEMAGNLTVRDGEYPLLTVESGVQLLFRAGKALYIGSTTSSGKSGGMNAMGASFGAVDPEVGWNGR